MKVQDSWTGGGCGAARRRHITEQPQACFAAFRQAMLAAACDAATPLPVRLGCSRQPHAVVSRFASPRPRTRLARGALPLLCRVRQGAPAGGRLLLQLGNLEANLEFRGLRGTAQRMGWARATHAGAAGSNGATGGCSREVDGHWHSGRAAAAALGRSPCRRSNAPHPAWNAICCPDQTRARRCKWGPAPPWRLAAHQPRTRRQRRGAPRPLRRSRPDLLSSCGRCWRCTLRSDGWCGAALRAGVDTAARTAQAERQRDADGRRDQERGR